MVLLNKRPFNKNVRREISGGTFYDLVTVTGEAVISDGTFNGQVENRGGKITGGIFNDTVRNIGDTDFAQSQSGIEGGTFMKKLLMGHEVIAPSPYISGGYFYGGIERDPSADKLGEIRGHTVTYMVDGKEYARQVVSGDAVTVQPTDPAEKKHYIFDGWYDGETKFTFGGKADSDITLTAGWNEVPAFQLRINEETNEWEYSQDHGETWTSFGVKASSGEKGDKGDKGETGATGAQGEKGDKGDTGAAGADGKDGVSPRLMIDANNIWCVSCDNGATWTSLGVNAAGIKGDTGAAGKDGKDGLIPYIGSNGNWWLGETDTGVRVSVKGDKGDTGATGAAGASGRDGRDGQNGRNGRDGVGIAGAEINDSGELVLTYTDGTTANLGKVVGADGADGLTPYVGENGNWWIGGTDTGVKAAAGTSTVTVIALAAAGTALAGNAALAAYILSRRKKSTV